MECVEQTVSDILNNKDILGLKYKNCLKYIDIKTVSKNDDGAVLISFYTDQYKENAIYKFKIDSTENTDIIDWAKRVYLEIESVCKLNAAFNKVYSNFNIEYRWSDRNESEIAEWDYHSIAIRLSKESINMLVHYFEDENDIEDAVKADINDIGSYLKNIDIIEINKYIGLKLSSKFEEALTKNMLSPYDIFDIVAENTKGKKSLRCIVDIYSIDMIAVVDIDINYKSKEVSINIEENKVLDIREFKTIKYPSLCDGICGVIHTKIYDRLKWV